MYNTESRQLLLWL